MKGKYALMIDAVRIAGGVLVVALLMNTKKEAGVLDPVAVERERKRLLDAHVLQSVLG